MLTASDIYDVIVIGGGQSALAVAYFLRRTSLRYVLLDQEPAPGGAWQHTWPSLSLFSPAQWSSLPGIIMPGGQDHYPSRQEILSYLHDYEARYAFPLVRPVTVHSVTKEGPLFILTTSAGPYQAKAVISATGTYANPYLPDIPGKANYQGIILHSAAYRGPGPFAGKRVIVAGEGNSGAQILAELSAVTDTLWVTRETPSFLPDDIDGRYLFDAATRLYEAKRQGKEYQPPSLGHIVIVPAVKAAREKGAYHHPLPVFDYFYEDGVGWHNDQREEPANAVIFCTGFRPALSHLQPLGISSNGRIQTAGTKALDQEGLWLVGYGSWTGFASATLIGVGRTARKTVEELQAFLAGQP
ncbi:MAG TPA: ArsO family NAD(P)H-dependent flavin-containing monooxygenase [Chitinophaga sp.]